MDEVPQNYTRRRHALAEIVPAEPVASPTNLLDLGGDVRWWKPSWRDRARAVGWKWCFALPALIVVGLLTASLWHGQYFLPIWMLGTKLAAVSILIPIVLLIEVVRICAAVRKDPFCIHCGYSLEGLADNHRCPECGRPYSFAMIAEYRRDPHWFIRRYHMRHNLPAADAPFAAGAVRSKPSRDGT